MYRFQQATRQDGFRSKLPLTNEEIARFAPSVLAPAPHFSRGPRYTFIPTLAVIDGLRREGFQPFEVRQTIVRKIDRRETAKHLVRLRHADLIQTNDEAPELVVVNSHDGTSSYQLFGGMFRGVCSNGLVFGDVCADIRVRHSGKIVNDVIEGAYRILDGIKAIGPRVDEFKSINLDPIQQQAYAESAAMLRWTQDTDPESKRAINNGFPLPANALLEAHRTEDVGTDLWRSFNRVQENILRGGAEAVSAGGKKTRVRPVRAIADSVALNRALWNLTERMAELAK